MKKSILMAGIVGLLSVSTALPAFAAHWVQSPNTQKWWYSLDNNDYYKSSWQVIDGKYYYFDAEGWMLSNTKTPDGYDVNADGQWVVNGVVQVVSAKTAGSTASAASTGTAAKPRKKLDISKLKRAKNVQAGDKNVGSGAKVSPIKGFVDNGESFDDFASRTDSSEEASVKE